MTKLEFKKPQPYSSSDQLNKMISKKSRGACILSFSGGKEAVGSWVRLREYFDTIIPVYYYLVPGLQFIERSLQYYEDLFQTKIIRVPNVNLIRMLNNGVYQTPKSYDIIDAFQYERINFDELFEMVKEDQKLPADIWTAVGIRAYDSVNRYGSIRMYGAHNETRKTFYPIYDYKIDELVALLRRGNVRLPADYKIWGKSFDGLDYRFIAGLRKHYPADYEKIRNFFPIIDAEILRYEKA